MQRRLTHCLAALAALACGLSPAQSQDTLQPFDLIVQHQIPLPNTPYALTAADFDGINGPDLAVAQQSAATVTLVPRTSAGEFDLAGATTQTVGAGPSAIGHGDFNGDASLDLITANRDADTVTLLGTGDGMPIINTLATGAQPSHLAIADFNNDGTDDFAVANAGDATATAYTSDGSGGFISVTLATGVSPTAIVSGDFDNDGFADLAVSAADTSAVALFLGQGDTTFTPATPLPLGAGATALASTDFNDDGNDDLAVAIAGSFRIETYISAGNGSFTTADSHSLPGTIPALIAADADNDGRDDLIAAQPDSHDVVLFISADDGTLTTAEPRYGAGAAPTALTSADFDGDGRIDLAAANATANTVSLLSGNADHQFEASKHYTSAAPAEALIHDDFDNDSRVDLAYIATDTLYTRLSLGNHRYDTATATALGAGARALVSANFNSDVFPDIALVNETTGTIIILEGNGDGSFTPAQCQTGFAQCPAGTSSTAIASADLNGDNWPDLISSHAAPADLSSTEPGVSVFYNDGSGAFSPGPTLTLPAISNAVAIDDFDGNGLLDIAAATATNHELTNITGTGHTLNVFLQFETDGGSRSFVNSVETTSGAILLQYLIGGSPSALASSDLNGDTRPDLVATNSGSNTVSIALSQPGGDFPFGDPRAPSVAVKNPGTGLFVPQSVIAADLNGDNFADLALGSDGSAQEIAILRNDLMGGFPTPVDTGDLPESDLHAFALGTQPTAIISVDADQNGGIDLLFADAAGPFISIVNNAGDFSPDEFTIAAQNDVDLNTLIESEIIVIAGLNGPTAIVVENGEYAIKADDGSFTFTSAQGSVESGDEVIVRQRSAILPLTSTTARLTVGNDPDPAEFVVTTGQGDTPNAFEFPAITGAALNTLVNSATITVSGIAVPAAITIVGGEYAINGGAFTDQPGTIEDGSTVRVRVQSADDHLIAVFAELTIGNISAEFKVTTLSPFELDIQPPISVPGGPFALVSADFDGQNGLDLAVVLRDANAIGIMLNPGNGAFDPEEMTTVPVGTNPHAIALGHFNDDSHIDLVTADRNTDTLTVLTGDGTGTFTVSATLAAGFDPTELNVADFNGDTRDDIVAVNRNAASITVYLSNDSGGFDAVTLSTGVLPYAVVTGHFTSGDTLLDLAVASFEENTVTVFSGDGSGGLVAQTPVDLGLSPTTLTAGDLNGDGLSDLIVTSPDSENIHLFLAIDSGGFESTASYPSGGLVSATMLVDVNGDDLDDILATVHDTNDVVILFNDGIGGDGSVAFVLGEFRFDAGAQPTDLTIADFNGNGFVDIITTNYETDALSLLPGGENVEFQTVKHFDAGASGRAIIHADFNDDGLTDIAHAATGNSTLHVLLGNAGGDFAPPVTYGVGLGPLTLISHDLNGDTVLDLVTANTASATLSVLLGNGDGTFTAALGIATGSSPEAVAGADLDSDGDIDLVVSHFRPEDDSVSSPGVSIHYNNGDGSFERPQPFSTPSQSHDLLLDDFNGDGLIDIATLTSENTFTLESTGNRGYALYLLMQTILSDDSRSFTHILNETSGTDLIATHFMAYELDLRPEAMTAADFDGNGLVDIAVTHPFSATISVLYAQDDPFFLFGDPTDPLAAISLDIAPFAPHDITTGDLDSDGHADLIATGNGDQAELAVIRNGSGIFTTGDNANLEIHAIASFPTDVTAADVNLDGGVDILFTNAHLPFVSLLSNDTDFFPEPFTFDPATQAPLGSVVTSTATQISGLSNTAQVTVINGQFAIADTSDALTDWTDQPAIVTNGQWINVRQTAAPTGGTLKTTTLTVGGYSTDFDVTTRGDGTPDTFSFPSQSGLTFNTVVTSAAVTLTGLGDPGAISVLNGSYSINGGAFTDEPGIVNDGDAVRLRVLSANDYVTDTTATLIVGEAEGTFTATTRVDTDPDAFRFADQINVRRNEVIISNSITVNGLAQPTTIRITGGEYAINDSGFTRAESTVDNGDTVKVRVTASSAFSTSTDAVISIGTVDDIFSVRTEIDPTGRNSANEIIDQGAGSGGCSLGSGRSLDPTLPALAMLAALSLVLRRRRR